MILRRTKSWQYRDRDGNIQEKAKAKMYYHLNVQCITLKHPDYALDDICMKDNINSALFAPHITLLKSALTVTP